MCLLIGIIMTVQFWLRRREDIDRNKAVEWITGPRGTPRSDGLINGEERLKNNGKMRPDEERDP